MNRSLHAALGRLLPGAEATLLLRALTLPPEPAALAWRELSGRRIDLNAAFRADRFGLRRLAPALHFALSRAGEHAGAGLGTVLRTAYARESMRTAEYGRIVRDALDAMDAAGIEAAVFGAAALGPTVYGDPALRHGHDIDLLVRERDRNRASGALAAAGFSAAPAIELPGARIDVATHASGLPLLLHTRLLRVSWYGPAADRIWSDGARPIELQGGPALSLSPELALLAVLGRASYCPSRASLQWALDACALLHGGLDADAFGDWVDAAGLAIPVAVQMRYLAVSLDAPFPRELLDRLTAAAGGTPAGARDVALFGARQGSGDELSAAPPALGFADRLRVARWTLLPAPSYVRWSGGGVGGVRLAARYVSRPVRHVLARLTAPAQRL